MIQEDTEARRLAKLEQEVAGILKLLRDEQGKRESIWEECRSLRAKVKFLLGWIYNHNRKRGVDER